VLVVDDSEGLRDLTKRLLQRRGFTVLTAANAEEALRHFEDSRSIDIVITDVVMPARAAPT
jgi:CheY-like chemotaxis protein